MATETAAGTGLEVSHALQLLFQLPEALFICQPLFLIFLLQLLHLLPHLHEFAVLLRLSSGMKSVEEKD